MTTDTNASAERRRSSRVHIDARTELHQGGMQWDVELVDISLTGLAVTLPADWDADYSQSFTAVIHLGDNVTLEMYAHLVHVAEDKLGFQCEHVDRENIGPLVQALEEKLGSEVVQAELDRL